MYFRAIIDPGDQPAEGIDQTWSGSIEHLIAIDQHDRVGISIHHRGQHLPPVGGLQGWKFAADGIEVELPAQMTMRSG